MQRRIHDDPILTLNGQLIPLADKAKFLSIWFDRKLNFKAHIDYVRNKCQKSLNLLKILAHYSWGADRKTLLQLFRSFIRSTLDYGSIVYGAARPSYLKRLGVVQNQALRLCLGAFQTSPISSLHVEANESPVHLRRLQLSLQYAIKLKNNTNNPTFNCVFNPERTHFYTSKPSFIRPLSLRIEEPMRHVYQGEVMPFKHSDVPPWKIKSPEIDLTLTQFKKSNHNDLFLRMEFLNLLDRYPNSYIFYTDGSKSEDAVGCAFHSRDFNLALGLPCQMSVYTAELIAINETLTSIALLPYDEFVICTDSLSSILAISSIDLIHPYVQSILQKCTCLAGRDKRIIFIWCPSHVGIPGNETADTLAKQALGMNILNCPIPHTDFKPITCSFVKTQWQSEWDQETGNKLHDIQPDIGSWPPCQREKRRDEIVIARLRIGHTFLTHSHLLSGNDAPMCYGCDCTFTVKHILIDCVEFSFIRRKYYRFNSLKEVFEKVKPALILAFLKEIGLFYRI
jgi:ribonuclease HI